MDLGNLLRDSGVDARKSPVLVMRHTPTPPRLRKALPGLAARQPDVFNAYQQLQKPRQERQLKKAAYPASFIGCKPGEALFVGLYKVGTPQPISYNEFWNKQVNKDLQNLGMTARLPGLWFDLRLTGICIDLKGKLIVIWPPKERTWARWADRKEFQIKEILEESALV